MTTASDTVGFWDIADEAYYADTEHVSASMLEVFLESAPLFAGRFLTEELPAREPTPALRLGTLFHRCCLEPERFAATVKACDLGRRSKAFESEEFAARMQGIDLVTGEELALLRSWDQAVRRHPVAGPLFREPVRHERAIRWQDPLTGIPCKGKVDRLLLDAGMILDPKTAIDPRPAEFARAVVNFGYHRRAAHYLSGMRCLEEAGVCGTPRGDWRYLFIVVGKEAPHEVTVAELEADALELGDRQRGELLLELARRSQAQDWTSRTAAKVETIYLPRWAYTNP